jgi:3-deoxy-D-manno-octulosonic acid (KDO) 8-phosphate synthase
MSSVRNVMGLKLMNNIKIVTSLKADRETPMKIITDIHQEFRHAQTLKVNYAAKTRAL